jgi:hypothetical protein
MDPQQQPTQPQAPFTPEPQQPVPVQPLALQETPKKNHKKLALGLLIVPTALFVLSLVIGLIAAQVGNAPAQNGELFDEVSPVKQILNILTFSLAGIGFLTWLPGIIVGIILLTKKK